MALLFVGYAGYYFCRTFFASIKPVLIAQYGAAGINKETLGIIATVGTLTYAAGKFGNTVVCDFVGGRRMFLLGMAGSVAFTLLFGASAGFAWFLALWAANRLVQSMGWGGLVKIASNWFAYTRYGTVMAVLSLTFVLGDAVSKLLYGWMLNRGATWQAVCVAGAAVLGVVALGLTVRLKDSPRDVGLQEPPANPANVYAERGDDGRNESLRDLLTPFLRSPSFWVVLVLSFGLTIVRDTFGEWLPLYLTEVGGLSAGSASMWATLFPFFGAVSIVGVGWCSDRFLNRRRGGLMAALLTLAVAALFGMSRLPADGGAALPVALAAAVALLTVGPYSFLAGAIALDLGARRGSATASGMVDGVGYLSGFVSGVGIGTVAERMGWGAAFGVLAGACAFTALAAGAYWLRYEPR
jgi:OPA family glycerol-3-phosphate transporter-like MFS transporter